MAGDWIKVEESMPDKPEVYGMAAQLGIEVSAIKGVPFTAREVAMFMVCVKLSRETHQRKRDNWVDIAGYAKCGSLCGEGAA